MRTIISILLGLIILWLGEEVQESALAPENAIPSISAIDEEEKRERMMDDNVLWFTDLFEYSDGEADSIASVMTVLESLDEYPAR